MSDSPTQNEKETNTTENNSEKENIISSGSESSITSNNAGNHIEVLGVAKDSNGVLYYAISKGNKSQYKLLSSDEMINRYQKILISYLEGKVVFPQK